MRDSAAYKVVAESVRETLDDGRASQYGGYEEREERRLKRKIRMERAGRGERGLAAKLGRAKANAELVILHSFLLLVSSGRLLIELG